jgi:methylenetetrahydrofolate dehydrogenase (NADP+)/methenyltetrahydrofolate cyclohydrolase
MTAQIIDGKAIAQRFRDEYAARVAKLRTVGVVPDLAVVMVGEHPASRVYVRNKSLACREVGMHSSLHALSPSTTQAELISFVHDLNANPSIHGILVQLPLPAHIDGRTVIEAIDPLKDVDGFHYHNVGALVVGEPAFYPCTPWGIMKLLEAEGVRVEGSRAAVVGRSNIVGKPMALMLVNAGSTVTVCHSKTRDLGAITRDADILVAAVGRPRVIVRDMVKPGAVVVDVGINRLADGTLAGDVDFDGVREVASRITPVPGGVGPMTIAMLLGNTVASAERLAAARGRAAAD